jgi:hypothetical protein
MKKEIKKKEKKNELLNNKKFAEYVSSNVVNKILYQISHILDQINKVNEHQRHHLDRQLDRFEEMMIKRQENFEELLRAQLIRVADDAVRANYSLQRLTQLIDDTLFTPEVRNKIINQLRMDIGAKKE